VSPFATIPPLYATLPAITSCCLFAVL
jgi:hypothetical protein